MDGDDLRRLPLHAERFGLRETASFVARSYLRV
jgi:hypothetical protein